MGHLLKLKHTLKGTVSRDFLLLVFFMNQFPPSPAEYPIRTIRIFSKIRGDIPKSRCTIGLNDTDGNFAADINDTRGKFATGVNAKFNIL
jgi:hypothetical protein